MLAPTDAGEVDYGRLVEDRRVHGSLYTDPEVFEDEIDRIFRRGWVFVGHESEVPNAGDWVTRKLGREPVIMVRAGDGTVQVLANRCAHRGTMLCWQDRGAGRRSFQCSYHGWVFSLDGKLRSLPGRSGFEAARGSLDLARPGQVESYKGFVFANQSGDAGSLDDHLGPGGKALIDRAVELSPVGRLAIGAGWIGQRVGVELEDVAGERQ
jgi:phenylpropionate dioxygenase-like ring-hydroxylating dioxygenase large terminal subunit